MNASNYLHTRTGASVPGSQCPVPSSRQSPVASRPFSRPRPFRFESNHAYCQRRRRSLGMSVLTERFQKLLNDRYLLERELGRGGMAVVFLARDVRHDRPVAIKVFRSDIGDASGAERFQREIRLLARLQHPHILPLYDSGTTGETSYFVSAYVEGETL